MFKKVFNAIKNDKRIQLGLLCAVAVVLLLVLIIGALRPEDPNAGDNNVPSVSDVSEGEPFKFEYSENFRVDLIVPEIPVEDAHIYYANYVEFDKATLEKLFSTSDFIKTWPGRATCRNNGKVSAVKYPTENFAATHEQILSMTPLYSEYYSKESLGFMTEEEVVELCRQKLEELSIAVSARYELYAIDHKSMQAYQDEKISQDGEVVLDSYDIKQKLSEDDDFYILFFSAEHNGLPVTRLNYSAEGTDRAVWGSVIKMYINNEGVFCFEASGIYQCTEIAESITAQQLISAQDAIDKVCELRQSYFNTEKVLVDSIQLEYVPVPYNKNTNEVMLVPAWNVGYTVTSSGVWEGETKEFSYKDVVMINAVTGEQIK